MLTGSRDGLLRKIQPISIHGQISCDVYYTDADDPEGQVVTARVGVPTGNLVRGLYIEDLASAW